MPGHFCKLCIAVFVVLCSLLAIDEGVRALRDRGVEPEVIVAGGIGLGGFLLFVVFLVSFAVWRSQFRGHDEPVWFRWFL